MSLTPTARAAIRRRVQAEFREPAPAPAPLGRVPQRRDVAPLVERYARLGFVRAGRGRQRAVTVGCLPGHKACTRCGVPKPLEDFPPRKATRDRRGSHCRACIVEAVRVVDARKGRNNHDSAAEQRRKAALRRKQQRAA